MSGPLRPAVFLDRDGTVILDRDYLAEPEGVELLPGAAAAIRRFNQAGIPVVLVTNQSGIGRGYFTEEAYRAVHGRLVDVLAAEGARLDAAYHCPHAPGQPCGCRKPLAGMFRRAAVEHRLDLARSWFVGDRLRDVQPAEALGGAGFLLAHGPGVTEGELPRRVSVVAGLAEVAQRVLGARALD